MQREEWPTNYPWEWIDTAATLARVVSAVKAAECVYLDLEADSMHHYYAKICLMQILAQGVCYLVDPLALDPKPLVAELARKPLVLHGADYDLRMLYQQYDFRPYQVFDTMLAAQLLGRTSFGLAALVQEHFGVTLPKEAQKADWSMRPLPGPLLAYAAQDTFFLPTLHDRLAQELAAMGRTTWHAETCEQLVKSTKKTRVGDPDAVWRITGSHRLYPRQLAVLKVLWEAREQAAQAADLPPFKILPSEIILRFAAGVGKEGMPEHIPKLPSRLTEDTRAHLLSAYDRALRLTPEHWPSPRIPVKPQTRAPHPDLLAGLRAARDRVAAELKLDPSLLAPRATLMSVALTGLPSEAAVHAAAQWMPWQENLLLGPWMEIAQPFQKRG